MTDVIGKEAPKSKLINLRFLKNKLKVSELFRIMNIKWLTDEIGGE